MRNREGLNLVWIIDERCFGFITGSLNTYYTRIQYVKGGIEYDVLMENDEFELMEDGLIEYDDE